MTGLQQRPSWHGLRTRVHAARLGICLLALLAACGPSSATTGDATDTGTGDTGQPDDEILWSYGGGERPVLSWPVTDKEGNIFVLVGDEAVAIDDGYEISAIQLVSISPIGEVRWTTDIADSATTPRAARVRPMIGAEQGVWVHHDAELVRVSATGEILWRSPGLPHPHGYLSSEYTSTSLALGGNETCYILPLLDEPADPPLRQELRAVGPDGVERWRAEVGLAGWNGADLQPFPTETDAPLVAPDGRVIVGCDTCQPGQIGLARVTATTGEATMMSFSPGERAHYQYLTWDGEAVWAKYGGTLWRLLPDGTATVEQELPKLVADDGGIAVVSGSTTTTGFSLRWGDDNVVVDISGTPLEGMLAWANPVAVVQPRGVLVTVGAEGYPPVAGLVLVDGMGEVTWEVSETLTGSESIPAVGDGFIAYIEDEGQRLVAVKAPVTGVADGPWPIIGGNPQGTRSVE